MRGRGGRRPPAQQRADARDELANAERLRQVVVGAAVEAEHFVGLVAARGQHEDRDVRVDRIAADGAADRDAVQARQHQVQDHEVERLGPGEPQRFRAVADRDRRQLLDAQVERDEIADVLVVFDDQHARISVACGHHSVQCSAPRAPLPGATDFSQSRRAHATAAQSIGKTRTDDG